MYENRFERISINNATKRVSNIKLVLTLSLWKNMYYLLNIFLKNQSLA